MRLEYSPAARQDLLDIGTYIHNDNPPAAVRFIAALEARCAELRAFPELGRERPELARGLRSLPFRRYVVFYTADGDTVRIERVLHGARDVRDALGEDED